MYESDTILGSVPANLIIILFTFCGLGFSGYQYSKVKNIQLYNADYQLENVHQKIIPIYEKEHLKRRHYKSLFRTSELLLK